MSAGGSADGAAAGAVSSTMLLALGIVGGFHRLHVFIRGCYFSFSRYKFSYTS